MITKYRIRARYHEAEIEEVEVLRETEQCVFLPANKTRSNPNGESRELKKNGWVEYYDTWEEAHAVLVEKTARQVSNASRNLELANRLARDVRCMRKPTMPEVV